MEININGALLNLNVFEANQAQRLVESYKYVAEEAEKAQGKSLPEQINIQCEAVKVAFDSVFGEGAGTAVCGYKLVAKTHGLARGMKATYFSLEFHIEQMYNVCINQKEVK